MNLFCIFSSYVGCYGHFLLKRMKNKRDIVENIYEYFPVQKRTYLRRRVSIRVRWSTSAREYPSKDFITLKSRASRGKQSAPCFWRMICSCFQPGFSFDKICILLFLIRCLCRLHDRRSNFRFVRLSVSQV